MSTNGRYLHTMLRVGDLDRAIKFYTDMFGMKELRRWDVPAGKFTNAFVGYGDEDTNCVLEFTYNYGVEKYEIGTGYGHIAIGVPDVVRNLRATAQGRRQDHPRAGAGEARHHGDRVRRGPGRLQDRAGAARLS